MVVHELPDDMGKGDHSQPGTQGKTSKTTGNAGASRRALQLLAFCSADTACSGARLACGVIGMKSAV